ncbi:porin [Undibacter mobilis]|uniref:Porin n=1 Tax=Undibacter mobilis TaxID=2292256 RepID=A0A371B1D0_9BRAD|nr:porin [Undibacter mobilis]
MKICSLYGAGFYYMPGTDTCIKVGGFVRAEVNFNAGGSFAPNIGSAGNHSAATYNENTWRTRAGITADARSQTAYGTLRGYAYLAATSDNSRGGGYSGPSAIPGTTGFGAASNSGGADAYDRLYSPAAFIQFAGFTAGRTGSFFDFDNTTYSNQSNIWGSTQGGNGIEVFAYTAQLGNGLSASIAAENNNGRRVGITSTGANIVATPAGAAVANTVYGGQGAPDLVGNLRIDQAWGSAQIMGAAHQLTFAGTSAQTFPNPGAKWGYAFGAGVKVNLPMLGKGDYIIGQFTYGKGAMDYVGSGLSTGSNGVQQGVVVTNAQAWDATVSATGVEMTTGWSITGGLEHNWVPGWKSSLYGAYGKLEYSAAASAIITGAGTSANWSMWQVGSRTVWTPVTNLDLSVEVMYQGIQNDLASTATVGKNSWWSGMFRAQRNFYP